MWGMWENGYGTIHLSKGEIMRATKILGSIVIVLSTIGIFVSFNLDTTVRSGLDKVHNTGLLQEQMMFLIVSCGLAIEGAIFFSIGELGQMLKRILVKAKKPKPEPPKPQESPTQIRAPKEIPLEQFPLPPAFDDSKHEKELIYPPYPEDFPPTKKTSPPSAREFR